MTIGIITPLPDGVLFVADGRELNLSPEGDTIVSEETAKINQIAPDVALISFGITGVTDHFLETLRRNFPIPHVSIGSTAEAICGQVDVLLKRVWQNVTLPPGTDLTDPRIIAGFGIGGLASGVPFVGMTVRSHDRRIAYQVHTDQRARIIVGGQGCDPVQTYLQHERRELALHRSQPGNTEATVYAVVRAAARSIREVEKYDPSVGGAISYGFFYGAPVIHPMVLGTLTDPA